VTGLPPLLEAALLGLVEGLTEFLPVSSTGHLILASHWLGREDERAKAFGVVIQLGAVLAVCVYYRALLATHARGVVRREPSSLRLFGALAIAFVPIAALGLALRRPIKEHLFGSRPVALALVVGGIVMLAAEMFLRGRAERRIDLTSIGPGRALAIGIGQCFALWPGASRSMTTIVFGRLAGLDRRSSAEFSFLLSIPVLGAATLLDLVKERRELLAPGAWPELLVGTAVSFGVALAVIAGFLRYLARFGLAPFGVYRVVVGGVLLAVLPA